MWSSWSSIRPQPQPGPQTLATQRRQLHQPQRLLVSRQLLLQLTAGTDQSRWPSVGTAQEPSGSFNRAQLRQGHELLLQLPVEPFDFPDNDPGPHTLLVSLRPNEMMDRLGFLLTRATNYVGVIPEMGARFTATKPSMEFLLEKLNHTKSNREFLDSMSS